MADLPELSTSTKRELAIKWEDLVAEAGLTGGHLEWHAKPPRFGRVKIMMDGVDTGQRLSIPVKTDHIGIDSSVSVAKGRFRDLAQEYWLIWQASGTGWETWKTWLDSVKRQVSGELASLWKDRSDAIDHWYIRVCVPAIEDCLTKSVDERVKEARSVELGRLERDRLKTTVAPANRIFHHTTGGDDNGIPPTGQRVPQEMIETKERDSGKPETFEREAMSAELSFEQAQGKAIVDLLLRVVERRNTTIEGWAQSHGFGRTTVFDWKAARVAGKSSKGKVSDAKCAEVEEAIKEEAKKLGLILGLTARTDPD